MTDYKPLTAARLAEMAERCEKATAGPLDVKFTEEQSPEELAASIAAMIRKGGPRFYWVDCREVDPGDMAPKTVADTGNGPTSEANALFIAHAREDLPACLVEIRRLREALESIRDETGGDFAWAKCVAREALGNG